MPVKGVIVTHGGIIFEGEIENWLPKAGVVTYTSGIVYRGPLKDWLWEGEGTLLYPKRNAKTGKEYKAISYTGSFVKFVERVSQCHVS